MIKNNKTKNWILFYETQNLKIELKRILLFEKKVNKKDIFIQIYKREIIEREKQLETLK